jgi:hypothetical protein
LGTRFSKIDSWDAERFSYALINKAMMPVDLGDDSTVGGFAKMSVPRATLRVELVLALITHFLLP